MLLRIADDFGLGRNHDRVILSLIEAGRLNGTSVMVNDAINPADITQLRVLRDAGVQIGLHLNLTQAFSSGEPVWPLATLMLQAPDGVDASFARQVQAFIALFGSPPDYYDGHQHCHCFSKIAPLVARLPHGPQTWVRVPLPAAWTGRWLNLRAGGAKGLVIMALAARARTIFVGAGLRVNRDFSGFLRLGDPASVRLWLPRLLSAAGPDCLMMLHPGDAGDLMQCAGHAPESRTVEAEILMIESATR